MSGDTCKRNKAGVGYKINCTFRAVLMRSWVGLWAKEGKGTGTNRDERRALYFMFN